MRIIEATLIVPLTILITAALIGLMMSFFAELTEQTEEHGTQLASMYETSETVYIRAYDRLSYVAESEQGGLRE